MIDPKENPLFVSCLLCGANVPRLLFGSAQGGSGGPEGIVRCSSCGLVYRNPQPSPSIQAAEYRGKPLDNVSPDWAAGRRRVFKGILRFLESFRGLNRICDVGAGAGFFLNACRDAGWECSGVEISRDAISFAREHFGLTLSQASLEEACFENGMFDAVTFWNVLDHLNDPRKALEETRRILRAGGVVVLRFPNAAFHVPSRRAYSRLPSFMRRPGKKDPSVFHLVSFDCRTIIRLLTETGFCNIRVENASLSWTTGHDKTTSNARRFFAFFIQAVANVVSLATFSRIIPAPSLLVTARKKQT